MTDQPQQRQPSAQSIINAQKRIIDEQSDNKVFLVAALAEMQSDTQQIVAAYEQAIASIMSLANDEDRPKMQEAIDGLNAAAKAAAEASA